MFRTRNIHAALAGQLVMGVVAVGLVALWPPADGAMLLVPLDTRSSARTLNVALAQDARLIGRGPTDGSVVVIGQRRRLWPAAWADGVLVVAAVPILCSGAVAT